MTDAAVGAGGAAVEPDDGPLLGAVRPLTVAGIVISFLGTGCLDDAPPPLAPALAELGVAGLGRPPTSTACAGGVVLASCWRLAVPPGAAVDGPSS